MATYPNAAQAALAMTRESTMPTQIIASLRSSAWPCTAELNLAAQLVNGSITNATGQSAIARAYTRPGDHRFSTQGRAMRETNVPPIPAAARTYPIRSGSNPSPPRETGVKAKRTSKTSYAVAV